MRKYTWHFWIGLGLFIVGFLAMTQLKAQQNILKNNVANFRTDDLIGTLIQIEQANDQLQKESNILSNRLKKVQQGQDLNKIVEEELKLTKLKAGLLPVAGKGMQVILADSEIKREEGVDPNNYYIHESFIREIVNAFWTGGAEAVSVNEHRLMATSEILCGGTTIFINGDMIAPPYVVKAIGDPNNLRTSINMDVLPFLTSLQQEYGIKLDVREENQVYIPPYKGKLVFRQAQPLGEH